MTSGWGANRDAATRAAVTEKIRQSAKERTCPECNRKGALKVTEYGNPALIKEYGYKIIDRKCRYCGYKDTQRFSNEGV